MIKKEAVNKGSLLIIAVVAASIGAVLGIVAYNQQWLG